LNKDRLHSLCYCSITELNKSIKIVGSVSKSDLDDLKSKEKGKNDMATAENEKEGKSDDSKKRKRKDESVEKKPAPKAKPVSGITTMIGSQDYKNTRKYENYLKWKDELIKYLREEEDDADN
jgi:hypothetical protein